jgi:hypothetical protein
MAEHEWTGLAKRVAVDALRVSKHLVLATVETACHVDRRPLAASANVEPAQTRDLKLEVA